MAAMTFTKLYTNQNCPYQSGAHRVHIALAELALPFEEEITDYSKPRTPEYLEINPSGKVPTIIYNGHIVVESAIIAQFLADSVASTHLIPRTGGAQGAFMREKIAFFVETYFSKANIYYYQAIEAKTNEDAEDLGKHYFDAIVTEVEPLLRDKKPFFNGSSMLTMSEVLTASFIIRIFTLPFTKDPPLPKSMIAGLAEYAPNFYAWAQSTMKHPSVNSIYNKDVCAAEMRDR
ncbi:thioredoxin-like protein [Penicillium macrosclerotiorum]|uniref:thioredoxin-like protein n=1 Tax=Penicillium macrosclerotiorum TaxID=303699 RepID=UPI0025467CF8|nr:thioredoxin-like protein [Penicillium macrosclerotiorum]KAJ5669174.1 thioredoxin-like protein [Penicillium macrosclerotiorum]